MNCGLLIASITKEFQFLTKELLFQMLFLLNVQKHFSNSSHVQLLICCSTRNVYQAGIAKKTLAKLHE